ncbi:hypothetical protein ERJ75_000062000 [Trypanosoma vivax]|nr:hypothetical protein ERJ75_000062000 [Trypanosoma vivax]
MSSHSELEGGEGDTSGAEVLDARAVARGLCEEACNIKTLLRDYTEKTRALGQVVGEFCLRDSAEEDALQKIALEATYAEMAALQDVRFVAFSQRKEREESDCSAGGQAVFPPVGGGGGSGTSHCLLSLSAGRPDFVFNLAEYQGIGDVLLGWRSVTPAIRTQFDLLYRSMLSSVPDISLCVLVVNGSLYVPADAFGRCELSESELEEVVGGDNYVSAEEVLLRWLDVVVRRSLLSPARLQVLLSSGEGLQKSGLRILGDGLDTLTIVDHRRLQRSAMFRGFFFSGQLRAIESVGAQANTLPLVFASSGVGCQRDAEGRVVDVFRSLVTEQAGPLCEWRNVVVILGIRDCAVPGVTAQALAPEFVVLDARPLSPNIPFLWHFTWAEVCALGQLNPMAGASGSLASVPVFKMTRVAVASLEPYDAPSHSVFPAINKRLSCARRGRDSSGGSLGPASVAASIAALVTVAFFAGRTILSFRRGRGG